MIKKKLTMLLALVIALSISAGYSLAAGKESTNQYIQSQTQEQIYGSQLMTEQERMEYQDRMRNSSTEQEREQIRKEHHERMKERAKERGLTLPKEPPASGMRRGIGGGQGMGPGTGGMGQGGGGKGPGGGRNQ